MEHMTIYDSAKFVPQEALKTISAGRLKGMSDVNPMWRIKKLTELFGPCGIGWWYDITDKQIVFDELTNQKACFVDVLLFYKHPETGEESKGIPGTGGASFVANERSGAYMSDECFKMALTDAISVAAKALGVAADVYFEKDKTKYSAKPQAETQEKKTQSAPQPQPAPQHYDPPKRDASTLTDADIKRIADIMQNVFAGHALQYKVFERLTGYKATKTAMKEIPRKDFMRVIQAINLTEDQAVEEITKQEEIERAGKTA